MVYTDYITQHPVRFTEQECNMEHQSGKCWIPAELRGEGEGYPEASNLKEMFILLELEKQKRKQCS